MFWFHCLLRWQNLLPFKLQCPTHWRSAGLWAKLASQFPGDEIHFALSRLALLSFFFVVSCDCCKVMCTDIFYYYSKEMCIDVWWWSLYLNIIDRAPYCVPMTAVHWAPRLQCPWQSHLYRTELRGNRWRAVWCCGIKVLNPIPAISESRGVLSVLLSRATDKHFTPHSSQNCIDSIDLKFIFIINLFNNK